MSDGTPNTICVASPRCRSEPFTRQTTSRARQSPSGGSAAGPTGQKVSNPLARVHWSSGRWRSRAVTSFTAAYPATTANASVSETWRARRPMTTPISPS